MQLSDLFAELSGEVCVCDPYYGRRSLVHLHQLTHCKSIRFLTKWVGRGENEKQLAVDLKDWLKEHAHAQIRQHNGRELHDRYLITPTELLLLGHGLKDIGNKESFIVRIDESIAADLLVTVRDAFEEKWQNASPLP